MYYKKDLVSRAIPPLQVSVLRAPSNPTFWYHLGLAYAKSGETTQAKKALDRALDLNPTFPDASDARAVLASLK